MFFVPISFQKNLVFDHFEEKTCAGTVFSNPNVFYSERFFAPRNAFPCIKRRNHAISDLEDLLRFTKILGNFERFWTIFERSWTQTLFLRNSVWTAISDPNVFFCVFFFFTLCVFCCFSFFVIFRKKNSLNFKNYIEIMYLPEIGNIPQKYKKQIRTVKSALEHFFPIRFPKTCFLETHHFFPI